MGRFALAILAMLLLAGVARAAPPAGTPIESGPEEALDQKIAVWHFDGLGIDAEIVSRLEALFRVELGRLDKQPLPSRRDMDHALPADLQACSGDDKCLIAIGKKLGVGTVVAGTVATLGDAYILDIKAIDVATGKPKRIQSDPLRGTADDLIEGVRVAAYRLLAPQQLHGAIRVQSDLVGAEVQLDGKSVGKSPLGNQGVVANQELGVHKIHVAAPGYDPFDADVEVHFQKVATVDVHLIPSKVVIGTGVVVHAEKRHLYTKPWFVAAVAVVAIGAAILIGRGAGTVNCTVVGADGMPVSGATCK
jgi:hypothetical protein|nr:PEGA domain-containing protein [Kofleriaceae bacterium]